MRGALIGEIHMGEVGAALDLDQGDVGTRIGADHLRAIGLAVIGSDLDGFGLVDHVVVGYGIAVGRDEETGALSGDGPVAQTTRLGVARAALIVRKDAVRHSETPKEAFQLGIRRDRRIAVKAHHPGTGIDLDADRNDRGLHLLDQIGEADRALKALGISNVGERWPACHRQNPRTAEQRGHADGADAGEQNKTARGQDARLRSGSARSHIGLSIFIQDGAGRPPLEINMGGSSLPGTVGKIKLW